MTPQTLIELLARRAEDRARDWDVRILHARADAPAGHDLRGEDHALVLRYEELYDLARRAAQGLWERGVREGEPVLLLLPTGVSFLATFFGCQLLGAIPVPLVPPWSGRGQAQRERVARVAAVCGARAAVTEARFVGALEAEHGPALAWWLGRELLEEPRRWQAESPARADSPAFIQFTSGSTAAPRGVVVEHGAALANCRFIARRIELGADDVGCSWLPLFHDMGLIGHVLVPLSTGTRFVLMPPEAFMLQPRTWLEAITRYRATVSTAPNFAYELCARRLTDGDLGRLELSSWRVAMCGGETVRPETLERFAQRFASSGFERESLLPVYGLAEATLAVAIPEAGRGARSERVDRERLEAGQASDARAGSPAIELVCVGRPEPDQELRVVAPGGALCAEREVGQIQVRGPAVMKAYYRDSSATEAAFDDGWLCTGDLGYLASGELFVVGRIKEMIVKGGRNLYPYDVEAAAEGVPGVRAGRTAAFGIANSDTGTEDLVLVCETRLEDAAQRQALTNEVIGAVFAATGVRPDVVHLVPPRTLSRTSSGKVQRALVRAGFEQAGLLPGVSRGG